MKFIVEDAESMLNLAGLLACEMEAPLVIYLEGDLGAGKTTFVQGIMQNLGYKDEITSPTFTFVEPYSLDHFSLYHFDLYRIKNQSEIEDIGIRDYFSDDSICIIEWASKAQDILPTPNFLLKFNYHKENQRTVDFHPATENDMLILQNIAKIWED